MKRGYFEDAKQRTFKIILALFGGEKMKCPSCNGDGKWFCDEEGEEYKYPKVCEDCKGLGFIKKPKPKEESNDRNNIL